jgi:hypothetical protein
MEEHFVNYNQALALKELGFDEPCLGIYYGNKKNFIISETLITNSELDSYNSPDSEITAPLKSQVFKWFRDKHNLRGFIGFRPNVKQFDFHIYDMSLSGIDYVKQRSLEEYIKDLLVGTHEEAESACIDKLIEIVKAK